MPRAQKGESLKYKVYKSARRSTPSRKADQLLLASPSPSPTVSLPASLSVSFPSSSFVFSSSYFAVSLSCLLLLVSLRSFLTSCHHLPPITSLVPPSYLPRTPSPIAPSASGFASFFFLLSCLPHCLICAAHTEVFPPTLVFLAFVVFDNYLVFCLIPSSPLLPTPSAGLSPSSPAR